MLAATGSVAAKLQPVGRTLLFKRLAILIPTRNRGELACRAALSILQSSAGLPVDIIISDNSTDDQESARIDAFLAKGASRNASLIRPTVPLAMTEHWQWAISQVRSISTSTHFFILTDRMLFKDGELAKLLSIIMAYPDELVSFTYDRIGDYSQPITFLPLPRTGLLYRMDAKDLLHKTANMVFYSCLPRMLNCVVPGSVLDAIEARFGTIFASISPDYCFCYRALGILESILYYDKSVLVNYASNRSNGASFTRGIMTRDRKDFERNLPPHALNGSAPIPQLKTVGNAVIHEYCNVRQYFSSGKFPEVALHPYLEYMASEIRAFLDPTVLADAENVLARHGWRSTPGFKLRLWKAKLLRRMLSLRQRKFRTIADAIQYATTRRPVTFRWMGRIQRRYGRQTLPLP